MASTKSSTKSRRTTAETAKSLGMTPTTAEFGKTVVKDKIKEFCLVEISKATALSKANLEFRTIGDTHKGTEGIYSKDANELSILEDKKQTPLLKWFEKREATYWLGFRLNFAEKSDKPGNAEPYINTVSLTVARSFPAAALEPLLRAEWDYYLPSEAAETKHAQPHWQIYNTRIDAEAEKYEKEFARLELEENSTPEVREFSPNSAENETSEEFDSSQTDMDKAITIEKFHFAMCAHWNRSHNIHQWPISEENLVHWLRHCLGYIRSQLENKKK